MTAPITVVYGAATDTGLRRTLNEDSFLAEPPLFLVADGMGGHEAGEVASATVIAEFQRLAGRTSLDVDDVRSALGRAKRAVEALPVTGAGAGTTLSGVVVAAVAGDAYWLTINVGDSRTYRLNDGVLEQISVDHSVVQELLDSGVLAPDDAVNDSRRNVITRAIGAGSDSEPDFWMIPAEESDRILVCSDGLSGELDPARILDILRAEPHPQAAATRLVHEAVLRGGRDNITAIVVDAVAVASRGGRDTVPAAPGDDRESTEIDGDTRPREGQPVQGGR